MNTHAMPVVPERSGPERDSRSAECRQTKATQASQPLRFPLGRIVATPAALGELERCEANPIEYLARHATGDWAEMDAEDRAANERAVSSFERVLSAYTLEGDVRLWVITEADRSVTTILLPSDY